MSQLDLTSLTRQQLATLLWELKGTPAAASVYRALRAREPKVTIAASDPDWQRKTDEALRNSLGIETRSPQ